MRVGTCPRLAEAKGTTVPARCPLTPVRILTGPFTPPRSRTSHTCVSGLNVRASGPRRPALTGTEKLRLTGTHVWPRTKRHHET